MGGTQKVAITREDAHASQNLRKRSALVRYRQGVLLGQESKWAVGSVLQLLPHDETSNGEEDVQPVLRRDRIHCHRWGSSEVKAILQQIDERDTGVTRPDPEHTRRDPSSFPEEFYDPEMVGNHDDRNMPVGKDSD
ncbi:hypothetical protein PQX77_003214, partial [Marasmius sp. AFHP31]